MSSDARPLLYGPSEDTFCIWRHADQILRLSLEEAVALSVALDFFLAAQNPPLETREPIPALCARCDASVLLSDAFCTNCGSRLRPAKENS